MAQTAMTVPSIIAADNDESIREKAIKAFRNIKKRGHVTSRARNDFGRNQCGNQCRKRSKTGNLKHFPATPKVISPTDMLAIIEQDILSL